VETLWVTETKEIQTNFVWQKANGYWFWDRRGVLLVVFMNPGATVTSEVYCETLKQVRRAFKTDGMAY